MWHPCGVSTPSSDNPLTGKLFLVETPQGCHICMIWHFWELSPQNGPCPLHHSGLSFHWREILGPLWRDGTNVAPRDGQFLQEQNKHKSIEVFYISLLQKKNQNKSIVIFQANDSHSTAGELTSQYKAWTSLSLPMLKLLSPKAQERNFFKNHWTKAASAVEGLIKKTFFTCNALKSMLWRPMGCRQQSKEIFWF